MQFKGLAELFAFGAGAFGLGVGAFVPTAGAFALAAGVVEVPGAALVVGGVPCVQAEIKQTRAKNVELLEHCEFEKATRQPNCSHGTGL